MAAVSITSNRLNETARPAEPRLASHLIDDEELDELLESLCDVGTERKAEYEKKRLRTGVKSLDDALDGGIESGWIVGVSGEAGVGASEICCALLVDSLLQYENSTAVVIDTTGNFDVVRFYTMILAQLSRRPSITASLHSAINMEPGASIEDLSAKILDRVKIMRVFDHVGMSEAIEELKGDIAGQSVAEPTPVTENALPVEKVKMKRTYVADSEDEEDDDDEEMLFESESTIIAAAQPVNNPERAKARHLEPVETAETTHTEAERGQIKFMLVDNFAHIFNPLLKKDYIRGIFGHNPIPIENRYPDSHLANSMAAIFFTTITDLTKSHSLHTLLINSAHAPRASSPKRVAPQNQSGPLPQQQRWTPPIPPSIFASNDVVPSLMHLLGRYTDMEILRCREIWTKERR
ncbi:hypothetical protein ACET3X_004178 [Alternaria dauci]|uniref:Rad51-like C-terminal domain-containing protein n=1 Tax=Alternaria dauci TaxID=48095 RepID=A0ABR3UM91_9PLEO